MISARATYRTTTADSSEQKEASLRGMMRELGSVLVAYSGGVDSAYLALIATQELGEDATCVMGISASVSSFQRTEGEATASTFGFNFETVATDELDDDNYAANPINRCYFCKSELYTRLNEIASKRNVRSVLDGTNSDDISDHRAGRAAAAELNVRSPLAELGFTKNDIRERSRVHGLSTWDKPASPCLASRVAHGVPVTIERLSAVERGESLLRQAGFREFRVRVHGDIARIEIAADELDRAMTRDFASRFSQAFKDLGFRYVTLDLSGFRSGSMNETTS